MIAATSPVPTIRPSETQEVLDWATAITSSDAAYFHKARALAVRLGAHYREDGLTQVGFWTPELTMEVLQSEDSITLETFTPLDPIDFRADEQTIRWRRDRIPMTLQGKYTWGVVEGLKAGTRDEAGCFYWLRYVDNQGQVNIIRDPLAYSLPYGVFAPAELYDINKIQQEREDLNYFFDTGKRLGIPAGSLASEIGKRVPRVPPPVCILQLHIGTASPEGTLEGLTAIYRRISAKLANGEPLTPGEQNYVGYDAIELLPIEPTIEYRPDSNQLNGEFFIMPNEVEEPLPCHENAEITATLKRPNTENWGYDVPILGSATTNPAILGSLRPDELVDFIATLHKFSQGPIQVIYDLVYGHADDQCKELLHREFIKGPNMYGQNLNHQQPVVRAILLEMERRKINTGADGVRIDGGQDFTFFNPLSGRIEQDDTYLLAMGDVIQEVGGYQRLMFTIFEDGRPWPQEGWEEKSRYMELIEQQPNAYQWGPLIFAHNSPLLQKFWDKKWCRVQEVMRQGDHWITGCANHDTVRRGTQFDPEGAINWELGNTLPEVLTNAYDNPAIKLWVFAFSPGLPMEFLNASFRGAWGFLRNTDDRYSIKVVSEEMGFFDWQVTPERFKKSEFFPQLKALGFTDLEVLQQFGRVLNATMQNSTFLEDVLADVIASCNECFGEEEVCENPELKTLKKLDIPHFLEDLDIPKLKKFARAFMEDAHAFANVSNWESDLDPQQVAFNLSLRKYRAKHPWLHQSFTKSDYLHRLSDAHSTLFYGYRAQPTANSGKTPEEILLVTHMGGKPVTINLRELFPEDFREWEVALITPGLNVTINEEKPASFELRDSQGLLLEKKR